MCSDQLPRFLALQPIVGTASVWTIGPSFRLGQKTMARVTAHDGARLKVREIGRGPVVILVHGFGMDSRHWLPIVLPLAHRFRFILPD